MAGRWRPGVAGVLSAALLVTSAVGCSSSDEPERAASARPTSLASLDVGSVRVARVEFCDRVAAADVRRALGGDAEDEQTWGNGETMPGTGEVGHELGCLWTAADGASARAWVFAPPVDADFARALVRKGTRGKGCTGAANEQFGSPGLRQTCPQPGGLVRERRAGLFGDTWLTCELTGPAAQPPADSPTARLDRWCLATLSALDLS